jgi:formylglycine-generating enzyme required for sulfatase activity
MKFLVFLVLFIFSSDCIYAQQTKTSFEYGYRYIGGGEINTKKVIKHKRKVIEHLHTILKGGIWDEILPNIVYVPDASVPQGCHEQSNQDNPSNKLSSTWTVGFYILNTEVTNKMYRYFLEDSTDKKYLPDYDEDSSIMSVDLKDYFTGTGDGKKTHPKYEDLDDYPIVGINRTSAYAFCHWLNEKRKRALEGIKDSTLFYVDNFSLVYNAWYVAAATMNEMDDKFTLKEFKTIFHEKLLSRLNVDGINYGELVAVNGNVLRDCESDGYYYTNPVKKFTPGKLGLYGLQGNAAEWAGDNLDPLKYDTTVHNARQTKASLDSAYKEYWLKNPPGPYGKYGIVQGGSWFDKAFYLQPDVIQKYYEQKHSARIGFRIACYDLEWILEHQQKDKL